MIGGLVSSTLLTLVLVPTLYTMVERTKERLRGWRAGRAGEDLRRRRSDRAARRPGRRGPTPVGAPAAEAATEPPARPTPSAALVDGTDQFEVLRLPKSRRSPLPPAE